MSTISPPPPFKVDEDRTNVGYRWKRWLEKFDNWLVAVNITDDKRQKALLLHVGGDQVYDIATSLDLTPTPAVAPTAGSAGVAAETHFAAAKRVLTNHFHPQNDKQFNQVDFRKLTQTSDESLDQFYARVREYANGCGFHDKEADIRIQLICGAKSKKFRSMVLSDSTSTMEQLLAKGRALEQTSTRFPELSNPDGDQINALRSKKQQGSQNQQQDRQSDRDRSRGRSRGKRDHRGESNKPGKPTGKSCPYCGGSYHEDGLSTCPANGQTCNFCGRRNHFESECRKKAAGGQRKDDLPPAKRSVRYTDSREDDGGSSEEDGETTFATSSKSGTCPQASIIINGKSIKFLLDTGSTSTIIGRETFDKLKEVTLTKTSRKIFPYGQKQPLSLDGVWLAQLSLPDSRKRVTEEIYVTSTSYHSNILSCSASNNLGLIKFGPKVQLCALSVQHQPLSKMAGVKVKLHLDPDVQPVIQPHRRIPYHYKEWLGQELAKFQQQGVIEKVTEPSAWVSPITIAEKPGKSLRLCVDMRQANKAIKRTRHVLQTSTDSKGSYPTCLFLISLLSPNLERNHSCNRAKQKGRVNVVSPPV